MNQMKFAVFNVLCIIVTCGVLFVSKSTGAEQDDTQRSPVVQTESGAVVGKIESLPHGKSVHEYLGIPYAEPPVGELRFAAPKPVKPWSGIKQVTEYGAACVQLDALPFPDMFKTPLGKISEDCLFLNVFVPSTVKPDDKMAVMVWIHGGGFIFGASTLYPGEVLAAFNDIIIVTVNYRLGVLGFFNIPGTEYKGNYGILDQVFALRWVQANIATFGGDPSKVTLFGESAGGMSVSLHLVSPLSKGLFNRAIMQSGASSTPLYINKVPSTGQLEIFAKLINCTLGSNFVECVRGKTAQDILRVQSGLTLPIYKGPQDIVGPTVDGEVLLDLPENLFKTGQFHTDVDVMIGFNSNEGALFSMMMPPELVKDGMEPKMFESFVKSMGMIYYHDRSETVDELILLAYTNHADPQDKIAVRQLMMDSCGHSFFVAPALLEAKSLAKAGHSPYVYLFDHRPVHSHLPDWTGVVHAMEVPFVFGAPFKNISDPFVALMVAKYSEIEKGLSLYIMKLWTDFAKYGSPNPPHSGPAPVTWPSFTEQEQEYLVLDVKPRVERRYHAKKVSFWNEVVPKVLELTKADKAKAEEKVFALKWVQANIASFGGDPNKVTIFGESAGGMSVSLHLVSTLSKGLFNRAIMQSGSSSTPMYVNKVTNTGQLELFAKLINCTLGSHFVECVRGKTVEDILRVQDGLSFPHHKGSQDMVGPIADGEFLLDLPEHLFMAGQFNTDVDAMIGFTSNECAFMLMMMPPELYKGGVEPKVFESYVKGGGLMYSPEKSKFVEELILLEYTNHADPQDKIAIRQLMMDSCSHSHVVAPALLEAKALFKGGRPPYVYLFDHRPVHSLVPDWMGVVHIMEVPFVFGAPFRNIPEPMINMMVNKYSEIEKGLSLYIMKLWTDFAKYGSPNPPDFGPTPVTWPQFTEQGQEYLVLDMKPRVERGYQAQRVAFWNEVVPKVQELEKANKEKAEEKALKDEL